MRDFQPTKAFAAGLDAEDRLARFREEFVIADDDLIYLDGNSLGRLPRSTMASIQTVVREQWGAGLIRTWNNGWWDAPARIGDKIGTLVGAAPGQVRVSDSTSVDLFKLAAAALNMLPARPRIVTDTLNFPSDLYILQGLVNLLSPEPAPPRDPGTLGAGGSEASRESAHQIVRISSRDGGITPDLAALEAAIDASTALVTLSHVVFKSGFLYDMQGITEIAHSRGALVLWDLSHSVGALPIALDDCKVDFAIGCTYKYLNGGPGSPAFFYVNRALQERADSPLWGWWGQAAPFNFELDYAPAPGIDRFMVGTQPMLSILAMEQSLRPTLQAGIQAIRQKSVLLTEYAIYLFDEYLASLGFSLGTPRDSARRGSHVSIRHPEGYRINRALIEEMNVLPDFRSPDNIRLGFAPLYTSFTEVWKGITRIRAAVEEKRFEKYPKERLPVT
jgi:kynureninase